MKTTKLFFTFVMVLLFSVSSLLAIPAKQKAITVKQSNGKTLSFILQGDEKVHWAKTLDGYSLLKNANGDFVYAVLDERGNMIASSVLASNTEERDANELAFVSSISRNLCFSSTQITNKINQWNAPQGTPLRTNNFPSVGTDSLLVILVGFSDVPFTYTNQNFVNLVSQPNYNGYGSVRDYYLDNSNNQFNMAIRVVGPYTLPNNMAYYGSNVNENENIQNFVRDVIDLADPDVDFSHFDNDNDGEVDGIHIIYAGTPESSTGNDDEIWPHRWSLWMYQVYKDNTLIWTYSCSAEKRNSTQMDGIGTMCHEFGHVLGFPDNYDTDYEESNGNSVSTGYYDLMASGSYNNNGDTPPYLSVGEKIITNWVTVDTLSSPRDNARLRAINGTADTGYYVGVPNSDEFFIFEMRKKAGWDLFIPGEGMLIYHGDRVKINNWLTYGNNTINVTPSERGWVIEPSTGVYNDGTNAYAPFGSISNINSFSPNSPNAPQLNDGTLIPNLSVTSIHYTSNNTMAFNYNSSNLEIEVNETPTGDTYPDGFLATGYLENVGSHNVTSKGIVYSTNASCPFNSNNAIYDNSNGEEISVLVSNLSSGKYYYRAFAYVDGTLMLSSINSVNTRAMDISEPYITIGEDGTVHTNFDFTPYSNASKFTRYLWYPNWLNDYATYWDETRPYVMNYFANGSYSNITSLDTWNWWWSNLTVGQEYELDLMVITTAGDSVIYTKTFIAPNPYAPNVDISTIDTFYYNNSLVAQWSYTMNENCQSYYAGFYQDNVIEDFASANNLTMNEVLNYLIQQNYITQRTANDTVAYYADYNTDYEIIIWAIGNGDTVFIKQTFNIPFSQGGTGLATANISVSNITSTSADVTVTKNSETFYYYYLQGTTTAFTNNNLTTATDIVQFCIDNDWTKTYDDLSLSMTDLIPNREYTLWAIPFNASGTMGTPHHITFTTLDSVITAPYVTISDVDTFYYNGSLASQWSYTMNESCQKYYATRYADNTIENFANQYNLSMNEVLRYLIQNNYIDEYTQNDTVAYYANPNTDYEIVVWAIGYGDTVFIKTSYNILLTQGGIGTAIATLNVSNITTTSADIGITINDQTNYYYEVQGSTTAFANLGLTNDNLILQYCLDNDWTKSYNPMSFSMEELIPNTEYKVYVFPFNANEVQGPTAVITFTTLDTSSTGSNPCVVTIPIEQTICEGESYMGQTQTGVYYDTIRHANACDTIIILSLNVMPTYDITIHDTTYSSGNTEQIDTTVLTLSSVYGCDSIVTIYNHYWTSSLNELKNDIVVNILPNPAKDYVSISAQGLKAKETLTIVDEFGRIRYTSVLHQGDNKITINVTEFSSGVYYIRIGNTNKKLIIE